MRYVPLFDGILESTLWDEALEVRTLYFTLLLLMDPDFVVRLDFEKIARKARLRPDRRENFEQVKKAMAILEAPDAFTMAQQKDDGIRVKKVEDGYFVVSGQKYQDLMIQVNSARRRMIAQRERRRKEAEEKKAEKKPSSKPISAKNYPPESFEASTARGDLARADHIVTSSLPASAGITQSAGVDDDEQPGFAPLE